MGFGDGLSWRAIPARLLHDDRFLAFEAPVNPAVLWERLYLVSDRHGIFPAGGWALRGAAGLEGRAHDFEAAVSKLEEVGAVVTYEADDGQRYGMLCDFTSDMPSEFINKRPAPRLPLPPHEVAERAGYLEGWRDNWPNGTPKASGQCPDNDQTERESGERKLRNKERGGRALSSDAFVPSKEATWKNAPGLDNRAAFVWLQHVAEARERSGDGTATEEAIQAEYNAGLLAVWERDPDHFAGGVAMMIEKGEGFTNKGAGALRFLWAKMKHWDERATELGIRPGDLEDADLEYHLR
ncbi:MAG: hypothetical protein ACQEXJ_05030 [Myxococcota bacterium]